METKSRKTHAGASRLGLRNYATKFLLAVPRNPRHVQETRKAVELFCEFVHHPRINELRTELIGVWMTRLRADGFGRRMVDMYRCRLIAIWRFAYANGDNHNPPPLLPGLDLNFAAAKGLTINAILEPPVSSEVVEQPPAYQSVAGRAVVSINGVEHDLGPADSSESHVAYHRLIGEFEASGRASYFGLPTVGLTVAKLLEHYYIHAKKYYGDRQRSEAETVMDAAKYLVAYANSLAAEFGPLQLEAARMRMALAGCCRRYCNDSTKRIVRIFRWAVSQQLVPADVAHSLSSVSGWRRGKCPARESKPVGIVLPEHVDAVLPHLHPIVQAMIQLQRLTGCRPGEICQMRPCDVDRSGDVWIYKPASHKTEHHGKERLIPIGPRAQEILLPFLLRPAEAYCFSAVEVYRDGTAKQNAKRPPRRTPIYPCEAKRVAQLKEERRTRAKKRPPGERYTTNSYSNAIKRACILADVPPWTANRLRHLAATEIRRKFGLEAAQVILGHSEANTTQIYAERDNSLAMRIAKEVG